MKITTSYRGVEAVLCDDFYQPVASVSGCIAQQQRALTDGNRKVYKVTVEADELLTMAKTCLKQLGAISGVKYKVIADLDGDAL